ncbi:acylphosphatase [Rhodovulum sp. ES.010]|uniref:acylphosphatase n=1 Tax=Rhodovulum sp. ES.010 TaxID=1882821 RepID=UPI000928CDCF|nr:acylphosphatase [Rhodovulum sp. ES.010]SIO44934.1 acylphosphatase [Rhodovulum sp. ES.010]
MGDVALEIRVTGRVQGVSFRAWTQDQARALGLDGWVRNEPDGAVTALVAGPEDRVARLVEGLHSGPPAARVDRVETAPAGEEVAPGFRVTG